MNKTYLGLLSIFHEKFFQFFNQHKLVIKVNFTLHILLTFCSRCLWGRFNILQKMSGKVFLQVRKEKEIFIFFFKSFEQQLNKGLFSVFLSLFKTWENLESLREFSSVGCSYQDLCLCYPPQSLAPADNMNFGLDNSHSHMQFLWININYWSKDICINVSIWATTHLPLP